MVKKQGCFEFGEFQLDVKERALLRNGEALPLTPKAFDTLLILVENAGSLVEKEEIMQAVWPDSFVEEVGLARNVSVLRKALGQDAEGRQFIETVPKRGYRFIASVRECVVNDNDFGVEAAEARSPDSERTLSAAANVRDINDSNASLSSSIGHTPARFKSRRAIAALTVLSVVLATALIYFLFGNRSKPFDRSRIKSIAVLPFKRIDTSDDSERLGIGMADTLITRLSNIRQLSVRSTRDVMKFENGDEDVAAAGKALEADAVLDGSIQRVADRLRVTVRLMHTESKSQIWAARFEEEFKGIFAVQDRISEQVVKALSLNLSEAEQQQLKKNYTEDVEAYQSYLKGRYFWNKRTREDQDRAIGHFEEAIRVSPDYALAYSGLADAYSTSANRTRITSRREELYKQAKAAALKAIEFDKDLAEAHASLGFVLRNSDWNWPDSEKTLKTAIELNPNYATAHQYYALLLATVGRLDEALAEIATAQRLDPLSLVINADQALIFIFARRPQQAIEATQRALEMDKQFQRLQRMLLWAHQEAGMIDEAIRDAQSMLNTEGEDPIFPMSILGYAYAIGGQREKAGEMAERLLKRIDENSPAAFQAAAVCAGMGDRDRALSLVERALTVRDDRLLWIKVDPRFDNLRADSRYTDVLRRLNLQ